MRQRIIHASTRTVVPDDAGSSVSVVRPAVSLVAPSRYRCPGCTSTIARCVVGSVLICGVFAIYFFSVPLFIHSDPGDIVALGSVAQTHVFIWVRCPDECRYRVEWDEASGEPASMGRNAQVGTVGSKTKNTASVFISGLKEHTIYLYRVFIHRAGQWKKTVSSTFRTLASASSPGILKFVFGSCLFPMPTVNKDGYGIFDWIYSELHPDFLLFLGDWVYTDIPFRLVPASLLSLFGLPDADTVAWHNTLNDAPLKRFSQKVPIFTQYDDHEIIDNYNAASYGGTRDNLRFTEAMQSYKAYMGSRVLHNLDKDEFYYSFSAGPAEFFVLDARKYASAYSDLDGPSKTKLGRAQLDHVKRWVCNKRSPASFKFLVSTMMWSSNCPNNDSWRTFEYEREEILNVADACRGSKGLILLSADSHYSAVFNIRGDRIFEFSASPMFSFPIPFIPRWEYDHRKTVYLHPNFLQWEFSFGEWEVDGTAADPTATFRLFAHHGTNATIAFTKMLKLSDF